MGIYVPGVSIPEDRDIVIVVHPDGAARSEVRENWGLHMVGSDAIEIDDRKFFRIYNLLKEVSNE